MTRWQEFPLRPQGQPWPGLNTKGGRLDPGQGQLEDGSFNAVINEADILAKRSGFIRGLDERFDGPVCGLFRYTSDCGVEYLIVADQEGIKVRTPFDIPTYLGSDSIPNDDFEQASIDTTRWTNTSQYRTFLGSMTLSLLATNVDASVVPASSLMQWFKPAAVQSYYVEIQYALVADGGRQSAAVAIKKTGNTYLLANVRIESGLYVLTVQLVQSGVSTTLLTENLGGAALAEGFLRLSYNAETFTVTCRVIPSGGDQITATKVLSELQNNNLGQDSAIGLIAADLIDQPEIMQVTGGSLGS